MKLNEKDFKKQLQRFIPFRGIDIVLHLDDGSVLELDKNRQLNGDVIVKKNRDEIEVSIPIKSIVKVDFFAA